VIVPTGLASAASDSIEAGLAGLAALGFILAFAADLRQRKDRATEVPPGLPLTYKLSGLLLVGLLLWRWFNEWPARQPVESFYDVFLLWALLLTATGVYLHVQVRWRGLALLLMPVIAGVLLLGVSLSLAYGRSFFFRSGWTTFHVLTVLLGSAAFGIAAASGAMYLVTDRQLRLRRHLGVLGPVRLPALAATEKVTRRAAALGFVFLTLAMVGGGIQTFVLPNAHPMSWHSPKILLALAVWAIYGGLMHAGFSPRTRGARAAWMSILGMVLLLAVYVSIIWIPTQP